MNKAQTTRHVHGQLQGRLPHSCPVRATMACGLDVAISKQPLPSSA
jgi:hypothetical protein